MLDDDQIRSLLRGFLSSSEDSLELSTSLTSAERRLVHEMASTMDLIHSSVGTGEERRICLRKMKTPEQESLLDFVERTDALVDLEREYEGEQRALTIDRYSGTELERRGLCLQKLEVTEVSCGVGGRTHLTLQKSTRLNDSVGLPSTKISPGDIVGLRPTKINPQTAPKGHSNADNSAEGPAQQISAVVYRINESKVVLALDEALEGDGILSSTSLRIDLLTNDVTYRRLKGAVKTLRGIAKEIATGVRKATAKVRPNEQEILKIISIAFTQGVPEEISPALAEREGALKFFDDGLNQSQQEAISRALRSKSLFCIHGPPGTGKTRTLVELIRQAVAGPWARLHRHEESVMQNNTDPIRVLAVAPSNVAVDNIVERLGAASASMGKASKLRVVRLGHPARMLPEVVRYSLDALVDGDDSTKVNVGLKKEINSLLKQQQKEKGKGKAKKGSERKFYAEVRELNKELRGREDKTMQDIVTGCQVVCCTATGASTRMLEGAVFDLVVIDEAAQAIECSCWSSILKARRVVLAGDHKQLPPTVLSEEAEKLGLGRTLFSRLASKFGKDILSMLAVQYRMHDTISQWCSDAMYGGELTAADEVKGRLLLDLPAIAKWVGENSESPLVPLASIPMVLVDTAGESIQETVEEESESKMNEGEAELVCEYVKLLIKLGLAPSQMAVITPYNGQVALLRRVLEARWFAEGLECGSVDGFQGREKDAIILSMVRSNDDGEVGFLKDDRRTNVAVTRAKRHVCIIGDSGTISRHKFLSDTVDYVTNNAHYWTVQDIRDIVDVENATGRPAPAASTTKAPTTAGAKEAWTKPIPADESGNADSLVEQVATLSISSQPSGAAESSRGVSDTVDTPSEGKIQANPSVPPSDVKTSKSAKGKGKDITVKCVPDTPSSVHAPCDSKAEMPKSEPTPTEWPSGGDLPKLNLRLQKGTEAHDVEPHGDASVGHLRKITAELFHSEEKLTKLICFRTKLDDDNATLHDAGITDRSKIMVLAASKADVDMVNPSKAAIKRCRKAETQQKETVSLDSQWLQGTAAGGGGGGSGKKGGGKKGGRKR